MRGSTSAQPGQAGKLRRGLPLGYNPGRGRGQKCLKLYWLGVFSLALLFTMSFSKSAWAQQEEDVITLSAVNIVGRIQKPIAAVGVAKIPPKLTLTELKQSFVDRIEKALYRSPF